MKYNISKELLSEVLKFTKYNFVKEGFVKIEGSIVKYGVTHNIYEKENIYELAHKCKEWALSKGYYLSSFINLKESICTVVKRDWIEDFRNSSEPQAVFDACEYIRRGEYNA